MCMFQVFPFRKWKLSTGYFIFSTVTDYLLNDYTVEFEPGKTTLPLVQESSKYFK